jgi:hypothetical protein
VRRPVDDLFIFTLVTGTSFVLTVTVQVAVLFPSAVAVMIASPAATPLTTPLGDTVAIEGALVPQLTFLLVALSGETVAINVSVAPTLMPVDGLFKRTLVTAMAFELTVTAQVAVLPSAVAVMFVVPAFLPKTLPSFITIATSLSLLSHVNP